MAIKENLFFKSKIIKFYSIGLIGLIIQLFVNYILVYFVGFKFEHIASIGIFAAASSNFFLNNKFTFKDHILSKKMKLTGYAKYLFFIALPTLLNIYLTINIYRFFIKNLIVSQFLPIIILALWNFLISDKVIWKK